MDEFYSTLYPIIYYQWILGQSIDTIKYVKDNQIVQKNGHTKIVITFHPNSMIEQEVIDEETNKSLYYIHFKIMNLLHAKQLYESMMMFYHQTCIQPHYSILLCCSGGLTTSYFALELMNISKIKEMNCRIDACASTMLDKLHKQYDLILLAPQISYMQANMQANLKNKHIECMPVILFATNNYDAMLEHILQRCKTRRNK